MVAPAAGAGHEAGMVKAHVAAARAVIAGMRAADLVFMGTAEAQAEAKRAVSGGWGDAFGNGGQSGGWLSRAANPPPSSAATILDRRRCWVSHQRREARGPPSGLRRCRRPLFREAFEECWEAGRCGVLQGQKRRGTFGTNRRTGGRKRRGVALGWLLCHRRHSSLSSRRPIQRQQPKIDMTRDSAVTTDRR